MSSLAHQLCPLWKPHESCYSIYRELQRFYYATPTSYLELIQTYKDLLGNKRKAVSYSTISGVLYVDKCTV